MRAVSLGLWLWMTMGTALAAEEPSASWLCADTGGRQSLRDSPCPAWQTTLRLPGSAAEVAEAVLPTPVADALHGAADTITGAAEAPSSNGVPTAELPQLSTAKPPTLSRILVALGVGLALILLLVWGLRYLFALLSGLFGGKRAPGEASVAAEAEPAVPVRREPIVQPILTARPVAKPVPVQRQWDIERLRALDAKAFESLCCEFWRLKNYAAVLTGGADGIDMVIHGGADATRPFAIVQCRAGSAERIGVAAVRELFGLLHHIGAKLALLYSVAGFTDEAREFAVGKHLKLVSGEELLQQIASLPAEHGQALLMIAAARTEPRGYGDIVTA